jgi:hypothetical protein
MPSMVDSSVVDTIRVLVESNKDYEIVCVASPLST